MLATTVPTSWPEGLDDVMPGAGIERETLARAAILALSYWYTTHPSSPHFELDEQRNMVPMNNAAHGALAAVLTSFIHSGLCYGQFFDGYLGRRMRAFDEAVIQTAINHASTIRRDGWPAYCAAMRKRPAQPTL